MDVKFADIEQEFLSRIEKTVWCTFATVDRKGRPRSRILHPIWDGSTGWVLTGRDSLKSKHIANNPFVSLCYWDRDHKQVYADCEAAWIDDVDVRRKVWDLYKNASPPMGYDPAMFFQSVEDPGTSALKLAPWRIELFSLTDLASGKGSSVWHA